MEIQQRHLLYLFYWQSETSRFERFSLVWYDCAYKSGFVRQWPRKSLISSFL